MPTNLSPYQQAQQAAVGTGKGAHLRLTPDMLGRIADSTFGPAPVPPGSTIIYQDASTVRWRDPEGFEHVAQRSLNGTDPNAGKWQVQTNRPNVLPVQTTPGFDADMGNLRALAARLQLPPELANLDPATAAQFAAISQAERAQLDNQLAQEQARIVAQLFGNRVNQSSIATGAGAQFAEGAGRLRLQQTADAAMRELQARMGLTEQGGRNSAMALEGLSRAIGAGLDLTGQQTTREIAGANIGFGREQLAEQGRQFNLNFELDQQRRDMELAEQRSWLNKILKASQAGVNLARAAGGGISAYNAITGR